MPRFLRDILAAGAVLLLCAVAFAAYLSITTVTVRNRTDHSLSQMKIGFTGKHLWTGSLEAGDSKWLFGVPSQDGGVEVTYSISNQTHEVRCGYVTGGPSRSSLEIAILPNGQSTCEQDR